MTSVRTTENTGTVTWEAMPIPTKRSAIRRSAAVEEREQQLLAMSTPSTNVYGAQEAPPMFVPAKLASRYNASIARLQRAGAGKWTQRQFDETGHRFENNGTPGVLIFRLA